MRPVVVELSRTFTAMRLSTSKNCCFWGQGNVAHYVAENGLGLKNTTILANPRQTISSLGMLMAAGDTRKLPDDVVRDGFQRSYKWHYCAGS